MKRSFYLGSFLVLVVVLSTHAADVAPGEVRKVEIFPANGEVRVEITLSTAVTAEVETAQHPDRLVVKLPGTISAPQQKRATVGQFGVRSIRFGLNQADPPVTHLVIDLDREHPYRVSTSGNTIILVVEEPMSESARRRVPPAAASAPLLGSLGRKQGDGAVGGQSSGQENGGLLTAPPSGPPINFPPAPADDSTRASRPNSGQPSARHPNRGGLQEGTVFPNEGAPGAGIVPPVSSPPLPDGSANQNTQSAANANSSAGSTQPSAAQEPPVSTNKAPEPAPVPAPAPDTAATTQKPTVETPAPASIAVASNISPAPAPPPAPVPAPAADPTAATKKPASRTTSAPSAAITAATAPPPPVTASVADAAPVSTAATATPASTPETVPPGKDSASEMASSADKNSAPEVASAADKTSGAESVEPAASGSGAARIPQLTPRLNDSPDFRNAFRIKFVAQDSAYLDGGRSAGLVEGMKLVVRDLPNAGGVASFGGDSGAAGDVAELEVLSVAETSAVTEIHTPQRPIVVGDLAYLSTSDQEALVQKNALSATRVYPAVVSFTDNDTLDDEARTEVPKPPLPSVNRARGRIGFDYIGVLDHGGSNIVTNNLGMVVQADITRLNGTFWNVRGYWRGRFDHTTTGPQTLQDLINRTYHLYTDYTNPNSAWVAGFGRMYLPWATSLDTIDGGYFGRKVAKNATTGLFLGSTPDPTSYSYDPHRQISGGFVNFSGGSYDELHYFSTAGAGVELLSWSLDRPFVFFENNFNYKRVVSLYQSSQLDSRSGYVYQTSTGPATMPGTGFGLGRSFTTLRYQPIPILELSLNHNYFRDLPTFNPALVQTGLLDKFLFQGLTAGARVEVHRQIWLSAEIGQSNRSGDSKKSLNQMYGITFGRLPWIGVHADARYSTFNSGFGSGSYEALSLSRNLSDTLQFQFLAGQQNFSSSLTSATKSRFVNAMIEYSIGLHYFMQGGGTISRGAQMNYEQWIFTFGYRFDNRNGHRGQ